jgi:hypothetical protein
MQLKLAWSRFIIICLVACAFLLFLASAADRNSLITLSAPVIVVISSLIFLGRGWARLREAASHGQLHTTETTRIWQLLIGPTFQAVLWFGLTLAGAIAFLFVGVLLFGRSAT